nr:ATP-binding protein [Frondihabitans sucicola]
MLRRIGGDIVLTVHDDGCGFDASALSDGFGLAGMRERIALVRGHLEVRSAPGSGSTLTVALPVEGASAAGAPAAVASSSAGTPAGGTSTGAAARQPGAVAGGPGVPV